MLRSTAMTVEGPLRAAPLSEQSLPHIADRPAHGVFAVAHTVAEAETSALVPHANNIVILGWIDAIASLHGAAAGASRPELAASGRMWFVARHEIDYLGEAFAGDRLTLATWVEKLGRTSLVRATRIVRGDGEVLTRATSRWALVDLATRRPAPIPEPVRAALLGNGG
jgi:acyl-CoA thioester hydrolase